MAAPESTTTDNDYEYEYTDETEDFYFTLDVTQHQPLAALKPVSSMQNKNTIGKQSARSTNSLQVLDLHSEDPLVKLGDFFYSCQWSTDLGTQFFVTKPGVVDRPLRPGRVLDVLGISRARLTGIPTTLSRQKPNAVEKPVGSSAVDAIVLDVDDDQASAGASPISTSNTQQHPANKNISKLAAAHQKAKDPLIKAQASFLERLAIIKHQKGETDAIPIHGLEELTRARRAAGPAAMNSASNGKRKSVSDDAPGDPENGEPSRKRHVSETRIAQDVKGGSPNVQAQRDIRNADVFTPQSTAVGSSEESQNITGLTPSAACNPSGQKAGNGDLGVTHDQTTTLTTRE